MCKHAETRPELGPLTRDEDLRRFNRAVVRKIAELGLQGPESLRFCRKVAGLGVVEFATLLGYDRKAVQRWETGEVAVPRLAMAFAATIGQGHDRARETLNTLNAFLEEHEGPTTVHVDAAPADQDFYRRESRCPTAPCAQFGRRVNADLSFTVLVGRWVMRLWIGTVSLLVLWVSGLSGCGGDEGPATMFEAGAPVAVSGPSPLADCEQPVPEECENAEIEPWIAINPTNSENLVGVWMQDCAPRRAHVTAVSFDGGATWETVVIPGLTACSGGEWPQAADPWLGFAANGDLYHAALQSEGVVGGPPARKTIVVTKSVDGGRTWGDLAVISRSEPPLAEDKESIVADPDDPCKVYVGWTRFTGVNNAGTVLFSRTTDCGETWSEPEELYSSDPTGIGFQALPALGDNLLAFFRQNGWGPGTSLPFFVMRSPDAGATWPNEPTLIAVFTQNSPLTPDGAEVVRSARTGNFDVAIDRQSGDLVAVWEQLLTEDLFSNRVVFSQSTDGGSTWSAPVRIDRTPSSSAPTLEQAFLPSVEISQEGTIGVTYYNFQNDTLGDGRADTDHWFIHCNPKLADCNDPESWSDGIQLTPQSFDFLTAWHSPSPANPGLFLGDYVGLTSTGSDFFAFFPVTTDDDPANILFVPIRGR